MADRDYPRLPDHHEVSFSSVPAATIREMIAKTFFSVSTDETRYHLNGVLFECDGKGEAARARMISTDGHRLSKVERTLKGGPEVAGVIIPRKGLTEIRRVLENTGADVDIGFIKGHFFLRAGGVVVSIKLIDAQFPPFDQVIPKSSDRIAVVSRDVFFEALKRVSIMSSDKTSGVKVTLTEDAVRVSSDNPDLGEGKEEMEAKYSGDPLTIGFNARYLIDVLGEIAGGGDSAVRLELNGELDPGVVRPADDDDYLAVVMPMRI